MKPFYSNEVFMKKNGRRKFYEVPSNSARESTLYTKYIHALYRRLNCA